MNELSTPASSYVVGRRAVAEAFASGTTIEKILVAYGIDEATMQWLRSEARKRDVVCSTMDRRKFNDLERSLGLAVNDAQGVIALRAAREPLTLDELLEQAAAHEAEPLLVVLDGITDPHNLGAIARSAQGAGVFGMILPTKFSAPITPTAVKASAGALETLPVAKVARVSETLKHCKKLGWNVVGTALPATSEYAEDVYGGPTIIVIGSEGEGLHPSVRALCDHVVQIPMYGAVESLNASVAAAIVMFEARKHRRQRQ
ncbi:MAG: 23S rRNA (guanosine(2251)-2'-O)-methyltransferase RlmB [Candidatus Kapabacteria bacterium]|nr:23S rRNA (guanosine(2251)-2'-O)-methyltransferase RlmB [Candidatus Kapabacteria bacterium]